MKEARKKVIYYVYGCIALCIIAIINIFVFSGKSDSYIRNRVVRLMGQGGMCSGEQVRAPSGQDYILSAGHCKDLQKDGQITVITEDGRKLDRKILAEDPNSDLLLLEGLPNFKGLDVAQEVNRYDHIRTFTHGKNMDTYSTDGVIIGKEKITVPIFTIDTEETAVKCSMPKHKIEVIDMIFFSAKVCTLNVESTVSTAGIVPGSSGGVIVDDNGDIIGVASATDGRFSYLVTLTDIQLFLHNY